MEAVVECALTVKCCRQPQQQQRLHLTRAICEARTRLQQQLLQLLLLSSFGHAASRANASTQRTIRNSNFRVRQLQQLLLQSGNAKVTHKQPKVANM